MNDYSFTDKQSSIYQNLIDSGCNEDISIYFLTLLDNEETKTAYRLLTKQRRNLLDIIHDNHRKLDCLDYLIRKLKKEGIINNES